jgi:hypothetical protein
MGKLREYFLTCSLHIAKLFVGYKTRLTTQEVKHTSSVARFALNYCRVVKNFTPLILHTIDHLSLNIYIYIYMYTVIACTRTVYFYNVYSHVNACTGLNSQMI